MVIEIYMYICIYTTHWTTRASRKMRCVRFFLFSYFSAEGWLKILFALRSAVPHPFSSLPTHFLPVFYHCTPLHWVGSCNFSGHAHYGCTMSAFSTMQRMWASNMSDRVWHPLCVRVIEGMGCAPKGIYGGDWTGRVSLISNVSLAIDCTIMLILDWRYYLQSVDPRTSNLIAPVFSNYSESNLM